MNKCPRCQGLLHQYQDVDIGIVTHCLLCGFQHNPQVYQETTTVRGRIPGQRCTNCRRDRTPGFTQCLDCRIYQASYRAEHSKRKTA